MMVPLATEPALSRREPYIEAYAASREASAFEPLKTRVRRKLRCAPCDRHRSNVCLPQGSHIIHNGTDGHGEHQEAQR